MLKKIEPIKRKCCRTIEEPFNYYYQNNNYDEPGSRSYIKKAPNLGTYQFYKDDIDARAPFYPDNTKFTKITLNGKLLLFKNITKCSEKAFDSLLVLFADVLP